MQGRIVIENKKHLEVLYHAVYRYYHTCEVEDDRYQKQVADFYEMIMRYVDCDGNIRSNLELPDGARVVYNEVYSC